MAGNLNQPRSLLRQSSFQAAGQNFGHGPASASASSGMGNEANFERATLVGRPSASGSLSNPLTRTFSEAILEDAFQDAASSSSGSPRRATRMDIADARQYLFLCCSTCWVAHGWRPLLGVVRAENLASTSSCDAAPPPAPLSCELDRRHQLQSL